MNSLDLVLRGYDNVRIYMSPTEVEFGSSRVLLLPWICDENREECLEAIENTKAGVLFGHLELTGFEMNKGVFCSHGQDPAIFDKFDLVCSGHFHHKSTYKNVNYLGAPFEMTWADYGDPKCFHLFDTETRELIAIDNPHRLFHKIHYSDENKTFEEVMEVDFSKYHGSYVKVIIGSKTNPFWYDTFIEKLEAAEPIDVKAVDDHLNLSIEVDDEITESADSTLDILTKTVAGLEIDQNQQKLLDILLRDLYNEALVLEA